MVDRVQKISFKRVLIFRFSEVNLEEIIETRFDFELDDVEIFNTFVKENRGKGYRRSGYGS